jgi:hypothetical protein
MVTELRMRVANDFEYRGPEMAERLAEVRVCSASAQVHAFDLALLAPDLAAEANALAVAVTRLAIAAENNIDLTLGIAIHLLDFTELDEFSERLRQRLPSAARPQP